MRATPELAASAGRGPLKADRIAQAQGIPLRFLLNILSELKHARIVQSHRGAEGGCALARPPEKIKLADVIRAVEGPLASVHEARPEEITYPGPASRCNRCGSRFAPISGRCSRLSPWQTWRREHFRSR